MKAIFLVFFLACFFKTQDAQAFSGKRCAKVFPGGSKGLGKVEKVYYTLFSVSTSTSQFVTSTGDCRMIGGVSKDERKFFIAANANHLRGDIIRADGDYLATMTFLYGCESKAQDQLFLRLQQNVIKIFGQNLRNDPIKVADEIDSVMKSDETINVHCSLNA